MENPRQNNSLPDHEHLAELKAKQIKTNTITF